jgi:hypothetical protein
MSSRDLWSHGGSQALHDLLGSALATLLLHPGDDRPAYFSSPWVSDFPLFGNEFRQFTALFPERGDEPQVWFSAYLEALSRQRPVRVVSVRYPVSVTFSGHSLFQGQNRVAFRFAPETYHEKGILTPLFYVEGSMNLTYSGVCIRDEKVTYHVPGDTVTTEKVAKAYLEFNRLWEQLT